MRTASSADGRTARRLDNRDRMLDAALELVASGAEPTAEAIATHAGVSVRSVYNHFPSARDLVAGMYERGMEKLRPLFRDLPSPDAPFGVRVRRWTQVRTRILEEIAPVRWHAMVAEERNPQMQPEVESLRAAHRADVRRTFPELADEAAVDAVAALTDPLGWKALRHHQGLPPVAAAAVIEATIRRLGRDG